MTVGNWERTDPGPYDSNRDALFHLKNIRMHQQELRKAYLVWMKKAAENGLSSTKVARELGISETAVRLYRKRNGIGD